ncbi:MAG: hypothetical protein MH825_02425 [Cyanobacteria bacterium]|nr:hypothetical protein [Cyanobacteriota bacterium]
MSDAKKNSRLHVKLSETYVPLVFEGQTIGQCTPEAAARLAEIVNREEAIAAANEILLKAFQVACRDWLKKSKNDPAKAGVLMQKYVAAVVRPETGPRAIAYLLRDRQGALGMGDREFVQFCDSYRLAPAELRDIYEGRAIDDEQLKSVSRIVGVPLADLIEIRDGGESEADRLAQLLNMSPKEFLEWMGG